MADEVTTQYVSKMKIVYHPIAAMTVCFVNGYFLTI